MSKKAVKWSDRTDIGSIFISLMIVSLLTFINPGFGIIYISDVYVVMGTIIGSIFIIKRETIYKERIKQLLILIFIGGSATGLDLTVIAILLAFAQNKAYEYPFTLLYLWIAYIITTEIIIVGILIGMLYIQEKTFFSTNSK